MADLRYKWNVVGHSHQLRELEQDLSSQNLAHAYLFAGPGHVGKFSLAKKLAQILQCENGFCQTCSVCLEVLKGYHPDTMIMDDDGGAITIEQMREVLHRLYSTTPGKYKILLAKNIERMTLEAANALLKTLEDPPPQVIFLLTSSHPDELLKTILSRVRTYAFRPLDAEELKTFLRQRYPERSADDLAIAGELAFGKPGKAFAYFEDQEHFDKAKALYNEVTALVKKPDMLARFAAIAELAKEKENSLTKDFLDVFLLVLRYKMLDEVREPGAEHAIPKTLKTLADAQRARNLLKRNVNTRLLFENLMLEV